jgi:hypothetical protein
LFLHTPLYAFYYALRVLKPSIHLCALFINVHWSKNKTKPLHKLLAWVDWLNMKLLSCQVLNKKLILIPYLSPLFCFWCWVGSYDLYIKQTWASNVTFAQLYEYL